MVALARVWREGILDYGVDPRGHPLPMYFEKYRQYGADLFADMGSIIWDGARMLDDWHWDWKSVFQLNSPPWQDYWDESSGRNMNLTDFPPKTASLTPDQAASLNEYLKLPIFDGNNRNITHQAGGWSDGDPLVPVPVPLTQDERNRILDLVHKRSLQGPMPADEEGFTHGSDGAALPPTADAPGWRYVYYWDHDYKKRQRQELKDPQRGWEYVKAEQWNREKNGWEEEGWDLGREYSKIDPNDAARAFAAVAGVLASILTFGAGTPAALAIAGGMTGLGTLAIAQANGVPISAGDYLNVMFKVVVGAFKDEDVQAGFTDMFSGVNATLNGLYKDVTQSSAVFSITTKIEEVAKTLKKVADRIDIPSLQRMANLMPPEMKAPFQIGIRTFIDYRDGRIDRFLADKITAAETLGQNLLPFGVDSAVARIGYFQAAIADEQSKEPLTRLGAGSVMMMPPALQAAQTSQALADALSRLTFPQFIEAMQKRYRTVASSTYQPF